MDHCALLEHALPGSHLACILASFYRRSVSVKKINMTDKCNSEITQFNIQRENRVENMWHWSHDAVRRGQPRLRCRSSLLSSRLGIPNIAGYKLVLLEISVVCV